jgi:hypothetical protein
MATQPNTTPPAPPSTEKKTEQVAKPNKLAPYFYGYTTDDKGNSAPSFGALCHQQRPAAVPVCAITDLENKIIMSNTNKAGEWVVLKARTNINNYWDASTAFFQCTLSATDTTTDIPPSPGGIARHMLNRQNFSGGVKFSDASQAGETLAKRYGPKRAEELKLELLNDSLYREYTEPGNQGGKIVGIPISRIQDLFINRLPGIEEGTSQDGLDEEGKKQYTPVIRDLVKELQELGTSVNGEVSKVVSKENIQTVLGDKNSSLSQFFSAASEVEQSAEQAEVQKVATQDEIEAPPLDILDEVCIFFGYLDTMRPVTQKDIAENRLLRRGVWVVDTVTKSGGASAGIVWTVQCRDRLKYLMDTLGSFNTAANNDLLIGDILAQKPGIPAEGGAGSAGDDTGGGGAGDNNAKNGAPKVEPTQLKNSRSLAIIYIARTGIGDLGDYNVGGRFIEKGFILDISDYVPEQKSETEENTSASDEDKADSSG